MATLLAGLLTAAGCSQRLAPPQTEPPDIPGYTNLKREFGPLDFTSLTGRRIVLDPGHGGYFRGAVGPQGLTEAEVNLGVALYLRGLLEWAGAEVHLTRSADYDFLSPADSTLSSDLAFRVNFANQLQPHVFLSIHHNSTASADPTINETQTYYPIGRNDASLDLARSIHRQLVLNLEISPAKILPGNFHVLREATVPAVLGEPAMISNPVMEGRLSLAASQQLEARAYFLGLLDYFAAGSPTWSGAASDTLYLDQTGSSSLISWTFQPGSGPQDPGPDPGSFALTLEGAPTGFQLSPDGHTVIWRAPVHPLGRPATLAVSGRNLRGRATPSRQTLVIPTDPSGTVFQIDSEVRTPDQTPFEMLRWWPSSHPGPSDPGSRAGYALLPSDNNWDDARAGQLLALAHQENPGPIKLTEAELSEGLTWRLASLPGDGPEVVTDLPPGGWTNRLGRHSGGPDLAISANSPVWVEARGILPLVDPAPAAADAPRTVASASRYWQGEKLLPGIFGAVIVLDPVGGGTVTDGRGPLGTRGSDINLETARQAQKLLEGAGATVSLTRTGELNPFDQDKVRLAGQVNADLFLTIGRSQEPGQVVIRHHPGSIAGQDWADKMAAASARLQPVDAAVSVVVDPSWAYLLRHTACPALEVGLPPLTTAAREFQAADPAWSQAEARAIFLAMATVLGENPTLMRAMNIPEILDSLPEDRSLDHVEWALLDGNFPWLPAQKTSPSVPAASDSLSYSQGRLIHGPGFPAFLTRHTLEIHQGRRWQLWLIEFPETYQQPRLMLEGP